MRWLDKSDEELEKKIAMVGSKRIVKKFLWSPKQFGKEIRWLEFANIFEEYKREDIGNGMDTWYIDNFYWEEIGWSDYD